MDDLNFENDVNLFETPQLDEPVISENDKVSKEISELSKKGYRLLKEGLHKEAQEAFESILKIDENNNYALVGLGDNERKQKHFYEAIGYYSRCLSFHSGNNYALFGLADCYKSLNQFDRAIDIWEQYLVFDEKNITVLTRVADAYRKVRNFKKSKEVYQKVLDMDSENAYALIGMAHLHYDFKEYKDALDYWTKMYEKSVNASSSHPIDIRVLTSIGNCHRKLKTFDQGVPFFQRALEMDPNNFYALFGLADCFRGMNQQFRSIEYWNRILEIDPKNKVILTRTGDAYRNMGEYKIASDYYNKAMEIDFDIYAALGLALICKGEGKYEEAIEKLTALIRNEPKNYRLYVDIADCYVKIGKKHEALAVLKDFQNIGIRNSFVEDMILKIQTDSPYTNTQ